MDFQAIIFDMDGVLIDSEPLQLKRQQEFLEYLGVKVPNQELVKMVGGNKKMYFEIISKYYSKEDDYLSYYQKYDRYFENRPIDYQALLNPTAISLLKWLQSQNLKIALASSGAPEKIATVLNQCGLTDFFDPVISGNMFKQSKPNPEIYLTVASMLNVKSEECVVIEDSDYGIKAGKGAGMYTIAIKEERFPFSQAQADRIVASLSDVPAELVKYKKRKSLPDDSS
ncbi:HAD family hydrolase [Xylocopilactobacillus apicola]|uniref:Haloacid dehalogenase n=1 Tax=Xylocopilactobacillus apicola TaxID=2932184 RepID=A0AAU9DZF5_9LACO|nr:HAD family phosphatase [Xylocopilactobacillus apicola]BDR59673.1 haloacid dehalogenase [Xylocopilactobacillus apicola]